MPADPPHPPTVDTLEEDNYRESEDEDFDVNAAPEISSSSEDEITADANTRPKKRRKISKDDGGAEGSAKGDGEDYVMDMEELDSGDEATIRRAEKKKAKRKSKGKGKSGVGEEDGEEWEGESSGGEGGFVRTRGMRAKEKVENKRLVNTTASNIDVDALWTQMNTSADPAASPAKKPSTDTQTHDAPESTAPITKPSIKPPEGEETITIHRTYRFAGETKTETKIVPASSEEAKLYLAQQSQSQSKATAPPLSSPTSPQTKYRRPLARLSAFDPNPSDKYPRSFSSASSLKTSNTTLTQLKTDEGPKLNTIEKSKIDWAGYVDREGIQEELVKGGRSKEGYLGRRAFLDQVEAKRDDELREARRGGK